MKTSSFLILLLMLSMSSHAKTLVIYGNVENKIDTAVYLRLCASGQEYAEAITNCPKKTSINIRLGPNESERIPFYVHWNGYKLHWKVVTPRTGLSQQNGSEPFVHGEASVVVNPK